MAYPPPSPLGESPDMDRIMVTRKSSGFGLKISWPPTLTVLDSSTFKSQIIMPIRIMGGVPMKATDLDRGGEHKSSFGLRAIVTPEEYGALMSGLANLESELKYLPKILATEAQVKRLEFMLIIQVGLLMAVFLLCRNG
jgi:hypothetical protein